MVCSGAGVPAQGSSSGVQALISHFSNESPILSQEPGYSRCPKQKKCSWISEAAFLICIVLPTTEAPFYLWFFPRLGIRNLRYWICTNYVNTIEVNGSQVHCHVKCIHLVYISIFCQSLFYSFPLGKMWWNFFLIKQIFIIPIWLKFSDYSSFSCNLDFWNLSKRITGAWRLHTMDWKQSNLTPVCSSVHVLKHKRGHSVEWFWHWLHDNHRFCIQTLADKKLIAGMKGTPLKGWVIAAVIQR